MAHKELPPYTVFHMTFTISAIETLVDVFEAARKIYRFGILVIAYIWFAGTVAYGLGQAAGEWYYQQGGRAIVAEQLAPTVAVARQVAAWVLDGIEWAANDGVDVVIGTAINLVAVVEWAAVELMTADLASYQFAEGATNASA